MKPKTEALLNFLLWSADKLLNPTFRNLTDSYEGWAYRNGLLRQVATLEQRQLIERDPAAPDDRMYRLTRRGRLLALGGRDPQVQWARKWDGRWRLVLFDVPTTRNALHIKLWRYLRANGFGCLQNSVWITPDPLKAERQIIGDGKINVESLILLEARPCAGESDAEIVAGAWDFERINHFYARHLKFLGEKPGGRWGARWRRRTCCVGRRPSVKPGWRPSGAIRCCREKSCRPIIWGNRPGGEGWRCSRKPGDKSMPSALDPWLQNFVTSVTKFCA